MSFIGIIQFCAVLEGMEPDMTRCASTRNQHGFASGETCLAKIGQDARDSFLQESAARQLSTRYGWEGGQMRYVFACLTKEQWDDHVDMFGENILPLIPFPEQPSEEIES